jgi:hypothetical protein
MVALASNSSPHIGHFPTLAAQLLWKLAPHLQSTVIRSLLMTPRQIEHFFEPSMREITETGRLLTTGATARRTGVPLLLLDLPGSDIDRKTRLKSRKRSTAALFRMHRTRGFTGISGN